MYVAGVIVRVRLLLKFWHFFRVILSLDFDFFGFLLRATFCFVRFELEAKR